MTLRASSEAVVVLAGRDCARGVRVPGAYGVHIRRAAG